MSDEALNERVRQLEDALAWVRNVLVDEVSPDCPSHAHLMRGRWDDNGDECEECAEWQRIWSLLEHP